MKLKDIQIQYKLKSIYYEYNLSLICLQNGRKHRNYNNPYRIDKDGFVFFRKNNKEHNLNDDYGYNSKEKKHVSRIRYYNGRYYTINSETHQLLENLKLI